MNFTFTNFKKNKGISRFINIMNIGGENANILFSTLKSISGSTYKIYFEDSSGSISIKPPDSTQNISIINTLTKKPPEILESYLINNNPTADYYFSKPFGKWVLFITNNSSSSILYNPVPRPDFADTYKNNNYLQGDDVYSTLVDYCYENNKIDPICSCLNFMQTKPADRDTEFCMTDLFAGNSELREKAAFSLTNRLNYGSMSKDCHCMNQKCRSDHPFEKAVESNPAFSCPDQRNYTFCNANFIASKDSQIVSDSNLSIEQQCGDQNYDIPIDPPIETGTNLSKGVVVGIVISISVILVFLIIILLYIRKKIP